MPVCHSTTIRELLSIGDYHQLRNDPFVAKLLHLVDTFAKYNIDLCRAPASNVISSSLSSVAEAEAECRILQQEYDAVLTEVKSLRTERYARFKESLERAEVRGLKAELHDLVVSLESERAQRRDSESDLVALEAKYRLLTEKYNTWTIVSG